MTFSGHPRIAFPDIRGGRPAVAGPRVRAPDVLGMPAGGGRGTEILGGFPRPGVDDDPDRFGERPGKRAKHEPVEKPEE